MAGQNLINAVVNYINQQAQQPNLGVIATMAQYESDRNVLPTLPPQSNSPMLPSLLPDSKDEYNVYNSQVGVLGDYNYVPA
jgi:hypothetical protein